MNQPSRMIILSMAAIMLLPLFSGCGTQNTDTSTVSLIADFNADKTSGKSPLEVKFSNASSGTGISWEWDFGDGSKSMDQITSHVYSKEGSYDVSLKVSSKEDSKISKKLDYIIVGSEFSQTEIDGMTLKWKTDQEKIHFILTAPTMGWVAVGIDPDPEGKMSGADFIIGNVVNGVVTIRDDYGTDMYMHQPDTDIGGTDTIQNKGGKEENGSTMITFELPLRNSEKTDKYLEPGKTYTVILSYAATDDMRKKHDVRTYSKITL